MSDIKWIKVTVDMFEDSKIEFLRSLPEGDSIIVIWLQLLSIAGKSNADGYLMITDGIPYTEQLLCNTLRRNPVLMQFAIETFLKLKMVNVEDGPFHITKWEKHQNIESMEKIKSDGALRQQRYRERQKNKQLLLPERYESDVTSYVTSDVTIRYCNEQEVRSKNKELKDIVDAVASKRTNKPFIKPKIEEVRTYCTERNKGIDAEEWYDHYTANGWKVGKNAMKDWKAAVRTWEKNARGSSKVAQTGQAAKYKPSIDPEQARLEREAELDIFRNSMFGGIEP